MTYRPLSIPKTEDLETYKYPSITALGDVEVSLYNTTSGVVSIPI